MTALAGVWRPTGVGDDVAALCARALSAQALYGPHGEARWRDGEAALGRRLFRLLPEDIHDAGPVVDDAGRVTVGDARLDNRPQLEAALGLASERAARMADVTLISLAWALWGEEAPDALIGDYAFVVWEPAVPRLVLVRDALGGRPLHYGAIAGGGVAFASTPKGVLAANGAAVRPDLRRMAQFLSLAPEAGPASFFEGVSRVVPGHMVVLTAEGETTHRHWNPRRAPPPAMDDAALAEALRGHLDAAVGARLRGAGGEVAAHLSSGLDSAAVATAAAVLLAAEGGSVTAFTAVPRPGFAGAAPPGRHADEGPLAALTAALHPNMRHVRVSGGGRSPIEDADADIFVHDRPVLNLCNQVWWSDINRAVRARGLRVLLTADFGNITISGDGLDHLGDLVSAGRWAAWLRTAARLAGEGGMGWRAVLGASFAHRLGPGARRWLDRLRGRAPAGLATYSAVRPNHASADWRPPADLDAFEARLWPLTRTDRGLWIKGVLGRFGVDQRDPTSDRRLVEFALSIPPGRLLAGGLRRGLARRMLAGRVAPHALAANTRGWQGADWHEGLAAARAELTREVERLEACAPAASLIDLPRLRALLADWPEGGEPTGGWHGEAAINDYRLVLLRAVSAGRFLRRVLGDNH